MGDIKVSVIVPIYRVEKFITRCAESLMQQTLKEVEFVFVDDCSSDNSISLLRKVIDNYPDRLVKLHTHSANRGLPSARNSGLSLAAGDYIFHCDADDYVEPEMLEAMYAMAKSNDSDIVWADWYLFGSNGERYMKQPDASSPINAIEKMLSGSMKFNVWNKLVKRTLYSDNNIKFPDGQGMGEDTTMMLLFAFANRISYLSRAFYHYNKTNINAISRQYSDKHIKELDYNVCRIEHFFRERYADRFYKHLLFFKLEVKLPLLLTCSREMFDVWQSLYPEANRMIWYNYQVSYRTKLLEWFASKKQFWYVWLYSKLLHNVSIK